MSGRVENSNEGTPPRRSQRRLKINKQKEISFESGLCSGDELFDKRTGEIGLENLGNTCFMNCSLQCLLHIKPLVAHFLKSDVAAQINPNSTKKGQLATSFSDLCRDISRASANSADYLVPAKFKKAVSVHAPYLFDYQQQDSHEFLRFLLDGLSDDVARNQVPKNATNGILVNAAMAEENLVKTDGHIPTPPLTPNMNNGKGGTPQISRSEKLSRRVKGNNNNNEEDEGPPSAVAVKRTMSERFRAEVEASRDELSGNIKFVENNEAAEARVTTESTPSVDGRTTTDESVSVEAVEEIGRLSVKETVVEAETSNVNQNTPVKTEQDQDKGEDKSNKIKETLVVDPHVQAEQSWQTYMKLNNSIVTDLFAGQLQSSLECQTCKHISYSYEPFLDISVSIPRSESKSLLQKTLKMTNSGRCTLEQCLENYTAPEALDDMFDCDKCKQKRKKIKTFSIYRHPKMLVVHIKRFCFNDQYRAKLSTDVAFPLQSLDMAPYLSMPCHESNVKENGEEVQEGSEGVEPQVSRKHDNANISAKYDLIGVCNHSGSGMQGGHYVAHVNTSFWKNDKPQWMLYDDERVSNTKRAEQITGPSAYILFYVLKES
jgi:ubiquitin C-terminal hydrolase